VPSNRFLAAVAGLLWGGLGTVFAQPWFSVSGWHGAALGLLIGVAVGHLHDRVAPRGVWGLVWLSGLTFTMLGSTRGFRVRLRGPNAGVGCTHTLSVDGGGVGSGCAS